MLDLQPPQRNTQETKGDYELSLDEWKIFLAKYNSATTPVTPILPSASFPFSQNHLQGIDVADFNMRLERVVETKIKELIDGRQGITIDDAAGGLCLRGYYHHPFRCALDGNYVPPPRFEPAGAYSPGEDWRLHVAGDGESQKARLANTPTETKPVSPTTYRQPGSGNRIQTKTSSKPSSPSTSQQHQSPPTVTTQPLEPQTNTTNNETSPSLPPPPPNSPLEPIKATNPQQHMPNPSINTNSRNSPD